MNQEVFENGTNFSIDPAVHPENLMPGVRFQGFGQSIIMNPADARILGMTLIDAAISAIEKSATVRSLQDDNIDTERALAVVNRSTDIRMTIESEMADASLRAMNNNQGD